MTKKNENLVYIVVLQNRYLLFYQEMPKKKGSFLSGVSLYQTPESTSALEINKWVQAKHKSPLIQKVEEWT